MAISLCMGELEEKRLMIGIYKITSPTGKVYIGQSWQLEVRWKSYGRVHIKRQPKLFASLRKYGKANHVFEVIHELPHDVEQSVMNSHEELYMELYRDCGVELMNIREAGSRGKHSEESKLKMSIAQKEVSKHRNQPIPWNKGKTGIYSAETINKIKASRSKQIVSHSEETKQKMRDAAKGRIIPIEQRKRMVESMMINNALKRISNA
jgi:group I intron endonuclease